MYDRWRCCQVSVLRGLPGLEITQVDDGWPAVVVAESPSRPDGLLVLLESLHAEFLDHVVTRQVAEIFDVCLRSVVDRCQLGPEYPSASTARQFEPPDLGMYVFNPKLGSSGILYQNV